MVPPSLFSTSHISNFAASLISPCRRVTTTSMLPSTISHLPNSSKLGNLSTRLSTVVLANNPPECVSTPKTNLKYVCNDVKRTQFGWSRTQSIKQTNRGPKKSVARQTQHNSISPPWSIDILPFGLCRDPVGPCDNPVHPVPIIFISPLTRQHHPSITHRPVRTFSAWPTITLPGSHAPSRLEMRRYGAISLASYSEWTLF